MICEYGCGTEAKYTLKNGRPCCSTHFAKCSANILKRSLGAKRSYKNGRDRFVFKRINEAKGVWSKGKTAAIDPRIRNKYTYNPFVKGKYVANCILKAALRLEPDFKEECSICKTAEWQGKQLTLELDHIDGDRQNSLRENLRLLCLNCHSQTPNFRKTIKSRKNKEIYALSK